MMNYEYRSADIGMHGLRALSWKVHTSRQNFPLK